MLWFTNLFNKGVPKINIQGNKIALLIGINDYRGTQNDLSGCINDVDCWTATLKRYQFTDIYTLKNNQATVSAVKNSLLEIFKQVKTNSIIVMQYSGHGTQTADLNGDESDGKDEALYLYDGLFTDDDFRSVLNTLPAGVSFTVILDSCHSGTCTRLPIDGNEEYKKPKFVPPTDPKLIMKMMDLKLNKKVFTPDENMQEILISGCKSSEYSYDANINGKANGAFTYYSMEILKNTPDITYNEFMTVMSQLLPNSSYGQTPQLEGSAINKNKKMFSI